MTWGDSYNIKSFHFCYYIDISSFIPISYRLALSLGSSATWKLYDPLSATVYKTRNPIHQYCVSQKEVIKILTPCCSKSNKNLTIPVCWTKCSSKISEKFIDHYIKYKRLKWYMYGTIFPTFAKCRSHVCGFTRVRSYTDQDTSPLSDPI